MSQRLEQLKQVLATSDRIVFFGGAGVSTESGIPDFRSKDGLYNQHYDYPPEDMLSHTFYRHKTAEFYRFYREKVLLPALAAKPNAAHKALANLEKSGHLRSIITQNIDGLHQAAGSHAVLELHGSIHRNFCERCGAAYTARDVLALLEAGSEQVPHCTRPGCNGPLKPDVILYEEPLDSKLLDAAVEAIAEAEVLIVGGTSLVVNPAAGLVRFFKGETLVVINKTETWNDSNADLLFREKIGEVLGRAVEG
jgi:NAD-dependent deacetylase